MAVNENLELEELIRNANGGSNVAAPEPESSEDAGGGIDFDTLLLVARRSLLWLLLLIGLGLTGSWLFLRYTKPVYKSSSLLKIDEKTEAGALGLGGALGATAEERQSMSKLSGEVELIKSNIIYRRLKDSLDLDVNYYVAGTVLETELYGASPFKVEYEGDVLFNTKFNLNFISLQRFRLTYLQGGQEQTSEYAVNQPIRIGGMVLRILPTPALDASVTEANYHFVINDEGAINSYLDRNLLVEVVNPNANTVQISFEDFNPVKARAIVNKIDTVYLQEKLAQKQVATAQTLQFLDQQLAENRQNLAVAEENLQNFARRNKTYDVRASIGEITQRLEKQEEERLKLAEKIRLLNDIAAMAERGPLTAREDLTVEQSIPTLATLENPQLSQQLTELNGLQWDLRRISRSYKEITEAVQQRREAVDYVKGNLRRTLRQSKELLASQLTTLDQQRNTFNSELQNLPQKATELARLNRPLELYEKSYLMLMDKKVEFNIAKAGTTPDFQILSPANLPGAPISPVKLMVYAIGLACGIVLGLALIAVRYFMHNTITNVREVERATSASVLGVIPTYDKEKMAVSKLIVDKNPKSAISESIRSIRTNLDFISSSKKKRLISVTSTVSGEGKTFVSVNLGGIIALSEQRVVILDLDMRKPKVNLAFGAENIKGISTILIEKHTVQECIQHTSIPTLDFISAGPTPPNPSELILNPRFDEMLTELHQIYDVILIDTPPVGLVTDGILIMRKADIPIYIVRANYSKKSFLKNINKLLRANNFTRLCTILNDASSSGLYSYSYGYGYGYGYGQGYYEETKPAEGVLTRLRKRFS